MGWRYTDDHIWVTELPQTCLECGIHGTCQKESKYCVGNGWRDVAIAEAATFAMENASLPFSRDQRVRFQKQFEAWGTSVDATSDRVSVSLDKVRQLARLIFEAAQARSLSKGLLRAALGCLVCPFQHAKPPVVS